MELKWRRRQENLRITESTQPIVHPRSSDLAVAAILFHAAVPCTLIECTDSRALALFAGRFLSFRTVSWRNSSSRSSLGSPKRSSTVTDSFTSPQLRGFVELGEQNPARKSQTAGSSGAGGRRGIRAVQRGCR